MKRCARCSSQGAHSTCSHPATSDACVASPTVPQHAMCRRPCPPKMPHRHIPPTRSPPLPAPLQPTFISLMKSEENMTGPRKGVLAASRSHTAAMGSATCSGIVTLVFFSRIVWNVKSTCGAGEWRGQGWEVSTAGRQGGHPSPGIKH